MTTRADLWTELQNSNVKAWLRVIRAGESNQDDSAYTLLNGGGHFDSFADHPYHGQSAPPGLAAGAYQYIPHTWQGLVSNYGFSDFSPECQDEGVVALIIEKGALDAIKAGYVTEAMQKLASTWVSLKSMSVAHAERVFVQYGGVLPVTVDVTQPHPETLQPTSVPPVSQSEKPMSTALAVLPFIMQLIPALHGIPGLAQIAQNIPTIGAAGGSPHATDYLPLIQTIADVFTKAIPTAANPMMAVGMATADPTIQATAAQAVLVHPDVVEQLNKMIPIFDKLHEYDKDVWTAQIAGRQSAVMVAQQDPYDVAPVMVKNITGSTTAILASMILGIGVAMILKAIFPDVPDWAAMIIPAMTLVVGQIMKERGAVVAYRWDGTPTSNATNAVNTQIAQNQGK